MNLVSMFCDPSGANAVRNSNRFDSKPSEALNPVGINLQCALNPATAAGPGSAPEGLLPRREGLWPGGSREALFLTG